MKSFVSSRWGRLILGVVLIVLAYVFASLAIDSGSLIEYFAAFLSFIQAVRLIIKGVRS